MQDMNDHAVESSLSEKVLLAVPAAFIRYGRMVPLLRECGTWHCPEWRQNVPLSPPAALSDRRLYFFCTALFFSALLYSVLAKSGFGFRLQALSKIRAKNGGDISVDAPENLPSQ